MNGKVPYRQLIALYLNIARVYFVIYIQTPLGIIFRIPGFIIYALSVVFFRNKDDQRSQSGKMSRAMDVIVEDREPSPDHQRFMEEYADKTLRLSFQFWIALALFALLMKHL